MAGMLAKKQRESGSPVVVVYSERPETPPNIDAIFGEGVVLKKIDMFSFWGKIKSFFLIRSIIKKNDSCVVVLHSSFAGFIGRVAAFFLGDKFDFFYIPHCISFMRQDVGRFKKLVFILLEWFAALKRCTYLACSESEQKTIERTIPFRRCMLVENAIEKPLHKNSSVVRGTIVITVGGIRPQKGPQEYAEIARLISSQMPHIKFVWIGDGDPVLKKMLLNSGVDVTGWLDRSEVYRRLEQASIYLSTARWEGMPVSVIEAMYCGLPVVASRCAGNIDVVKHGDNGWLFDAPSDACEFIAPLFADEKLAANVAQRAYFDACERFTPERYFQAMSKIMASSSH